MSEFDAIPVDDPTDPFETIELAIRADRDAEVAARRWRLTAPTRYQAATIAGLLERGGAGEQIAEWAFGPEGRNLVIAGPVGTGKTWAALAAVRPAIEAGSSVVFWPVVELLDALRPGGRDDTLETAMRCDVLVLDDVGAERATDWAAERMYAIVNRRWMDGRPIVATTNHASSDALVEHIGERMRSRLVGSGAVVVRLTGADRRRETITPTPKDTPT